MTEVRAAGPLLWLRAGLLAVIALLTGVVSHAAAGGLLPSVFSLVALAAAITVGAAWVLRRRLPRLGLIALAVAGQTSAHLVLSVLAGHRGDPRVVPLQAVGGRGSVQDALMGGYADPPPQPSVGWTSHLVDHVADIGPAMVVAHLLGAVVLAGWLSVGEAALWALLLFVAAEVRTLLAHPVHSCSRLLAVPPGVLAAGVLQRDLLVLGAVTRRGPPLPV